MRQHILAVFQIIYITVVLYTVYSANRIKMSHTVLKVEPNLTIVDGLSTSIKDFQKIGNSTDELSYVYSAFYEKHSWIDEHNNQSIIVLIAGLTEFFNKPLFCKIYYTIGLMLVSKIVPASLMKLKYENRYWRLPYIPYYIFCNLGDVSRAKFTHSPAFVSITDSEHEEEQPTNLLRIQYKDTSKKYKFVLCTQPLYNFEDPLLLAEWIELHRRMGVEKIILYNTTIGPKTSCLIESYGHFIETLPWSSPYTAFKDIVSNAQQIQNHDCLERFKGVSEYLVIVDRDEMIIPSPTAGNNYFEMLASINQKIDSQYKTMDDISGYVFQNGFFENSFMSEKETNPKIDSVNHNLFANEIVRKLQIAIRTKRRKFLEPHKIRSKYILLPEKVIELATHKIVESSKNSKVINVDGNMAYSHHYRSESPKCDPELDFGCEVVTENSAKRFAKDVTESLARHLQSNAKHCNIIKN